MRTETFEFRCVDGCWLLSGPFDVSRCKESCSMNLVITNVLRVAVEFKEKLL